MSFRASHITRNFDITTQKRSHVNNKLVQLKIRRTNKKYIQFTLPNYGTMNLKSKYDHLKDFNYNAGYSDWNSWYCIVHPNYIGAESTTEGETEVTEETEENELVLDYEVHDIAKKEFIKEYNSLGGFSTPSGYVETETILYQMPDPDSEQTHFVVELNYTAPFDGEYNIETLYSCKKEGTLDNKIYINGIETENNQTWESFPEIFNRNICRTHLKKGSNTITILADVNTIILGNMVKKVETLIGDTVNDGDFVLKSANVKLSEKPTVDEMTVEIFNENYFTKQNTDYHVEMNQNKFIFDYHDEVTLIVENDNNEKEILFGGYISSITFDEDRMTVTLNCASRLYDCEERTTLIETTFRTGDKEYDDYEDKFIRDFNSYAKLLNYFTKSTEVPLKNNIDLSAELISGETEYIKQWWNFGSENESYTDFDSSYKENVTVSDHKDSILIRNDPPKGVHDEFELVNMALFPSVEAEGVHINEMPVLSVWYGLAEPMTEIGGSGSGVSVSDDADANEVANAILDDLGSGASTYDKIRAAFDYWDGAIASDPYSCRQKSIKDMINSGLANCYDSAYALTETIRAMGIQAGYYTSDSFVDDLGDNYSHGWSYAVDDNGNEIVMDVGRDSARFDCGGEYSRFSPNKRDELGC